MINAIRVGGPHYGTEIGVANRERVGEGELKRNIAFHVIAHRLRGLRVDPVVIFTAVPGLVARRTTVIERRDALRSRLR